MMSVPKSTVGKPLSDAAFHVNRGGGKSLVSATTVAAAADFSPLMRRFAPLLTSRRRSFPGTRCASSPAGGGPSFLEGTESFRKTVAVHHRSACVRDQLTIP